MKILLNNKLKSCWNFVGQWMEKGDFDDNARMEAILPGTHELSFQSGSYFAPVTGYVIYLSDDKTLFLCILIQTNNQFLALVSRTTPDCRELLLQGRLPDLGPRARRSEGCYWQRDSVTKVVSLTVFGPDLSILAPDELETCTHAEHDDWVGVNLMERRRDYDKTAVKMTIENKFSESFIFDGMMPEDSTWCVVPDKIVSGETTSVELKYKGAFSAKGVCWFVSEHSRDTYLSVIFSVSSLGSPTFEVWAGEPPFDLRQQLAKSAGHKGKKVRGSVHESLGCSWTVNNDSKSGCLSIELTVHADLTPYNPLSYPPVASTPPTETVPRNPAATSTAIVAVTDPQQQAVESMVTDMFNRTRPKNALVGLGSGLKYMVGGVVAGAAALVAGPIVGGQEEGAVGVVKGLGKGIGGMVGLTVGGIAIGAAQIGRGIVNTGEAITKGTRDDYKWDKEKGEWVKDLYCLRDLYQEALDEEEQSDEEEREQRRKRTGQVLETHYYELLGIQTEATAADIKKAYYKKAVILHPDKNTSDPNANARFIELKQAYHVLSDPELRVKYDSAGAKSLEEASPDFDPAIFFATLFGSQKFESYIGELSFSTLVKELMKEMDHAQSEQEAADMARNTSNRAVNAEKRRQKRRSVTCAKWLAQKLDMYVVERDEGGFIRWAYIEAMELKSANFGRHLLNSLAWVYIYRAEKFLAEEMGETINRKLIGWRATGRNWSNMGTLVKNAAYSISAVNKMNNKAKDMIPDSAPTNDQRTDFADEIEKSLPILLETAWNKCQVDVEDTIKLSTRIMLKDVSVPWQLRVRRARALKILGHIFQDVALSYNDATFDVSSRTGSDIRTTVEEALFNSIKKSK